MTNTTGDGITINAAATFASLVSNGELNIGSSVTGGSTSSTMQINNTLNLNDGTQLTDIEILAPTGANQMFSLGTNTLTNVTLDAGTTLNMKASTIYSSGLTNDGTVQGNGTIEGTLTNGGIVDANQPAQNLLFVVSTTTNTGTLEATNGGVLEYNGSTLNDSGILKADGAGSQVMLDGGVVFTASNDKLSTSNGGLIVANGATIEGTIGSGTLSFTDNGSNILNGATVNGNLDLATISNAQLSNQGSTTLTGTTNLGTGSIMYVQGASSNLINQGTVEGSGTIDTYNFGTFTNTGTVQSTTGGILSLDNGTVNDSGTLKADGAGSQVMLDGGVVFTANNDTLSTSNGGLIVANGATIEGTLGSGTLSFADNGSNYLGGATVNGNLDLASIANAQVSNQGVSNLNGTTTLGTGSDIYVEGSTSNLVNNGTMQGEGTVNTFNNGTFTNTGTVQSTTGGTLDIYSGTFNDSGTLKADGAGSQVMLGGGVILNATNDTLSTSNGGLVVANDATIQGTVGSGTLSFADNGSNYLNGTTINGNLDLATIVNAQVSNQGTSTLNGTTTLAAGSDIYVQGATSNLNNQGTVQGAGTINVYNNGTFTNSGTVQSTTGGTLALYGGTLNDSGTLKADGAGSQLLIDGEATLNAVKDTISTSNGGLVIVSGATIQGTVGSGTLSFADNGSNYLNGATINGNLDLATIAYAQVYNQGVSTLNGTTTLGAGSDLYVQGSTSNLNNQGMVQGEGTIDVYNNGAFSNNGTVNANQTGKTLLVQGNATNEGTLAASNGGTLRLTDTGGSPIGGNVNIATDSTVYLPTGITQSSGSSTVDGSLNTVNGSYDMNGGTLNGIGQINMSVVQSGGTFNPGSDPSSMSITGNLTIKGGTYQLDLASLSSFDTLGVSGTTSINGGNLYLDFLGGYLPGLNNSYQFLTSGSFAPGQTGFSSISSDLTGYGFAYNNGMVTVTNVPPPAVPEASSVTSLAALMGFGFVGLFKKRKTNSH